MEQSQSKKLSEITSSVMQICSKREMCRSEVEEKLTKWNLSIDDIEDIILKLESNNFINEERFTSFFIRDKLKFNKWGKIKLRYYLKLKRIPDHIINKELDNLDEQQYIQILKSELEKKFKSLNSKKSEMDKLVRFAQSKGFELELILSVIKDLVK